jgi:hypothetical protein
MGRLSDVLLSRAPNIFTFEGFVTPETLAILNRSEKSKAMDAAVDHLWRKEMKRRMQQIETVNFTGLRTSALSMEFGRDAARLGEYTGAIFHFQSALPLKKVGMDRAEAFLHIGDCNHARKYEGAARVSYKTALTEAAKEKDAHNSDMRKLKAYCYAGLASTYKVDGNGENTFGTRTFRSYEYLTKAVAELNEVDFEGTQGDDLVRAWNIYHAYLNLRHLDGFKYLSSKIERKRLEKNVADIGRLLGW